MRRCKYRKCKCYPPPPQPDDASEIEQEYSKNSFGVYAKVGLLGYIGKSYCPTYSYTCYTNYDYNFVPGISAYYAWRGSSGMGVEIALEYEYNASDGIASDISKIKRNFITPAIYFSEQTHGVIWRVGLGYDIGLPYKYAALDQSWQVTENYHGVAIMSSSEWFLNKNNAIGIFVKGSFRFENAKDTDVNIANNITGTEFDHIMLTLGLNYRFNMGF